MRRNALKITVVISGRRGIGRTREIMLDGQDVGMEEYYHWD